MEKVSEILMILFGGLNVFQFFFFKAERRKAIASANSAELDNAKKEISIRSDEYELIYSKLDKLTKDYFAMIERAQSAMEEAASLKSEITYLKGLRCYITICQNRKQNKDTNNE